MTYNFTSATGRTFAATINNPADIVINGATFHLTRDGRLRTNSADSARKFFKSLGVTDTAERVEITPTAADLQEIRKIGHLLSWPVEIQQKFITAAQTGAPVMIDKDLKESALFGNDHSTLCDVTRWAMPDGSVKTDVVHHY
jgi:hypothetical protein